MTAAPVAGGDGLAALSGPTAQSWPHALGRLRHDSYHLPAYVVTDAALTDGSPRAFRFDDGDDLLLVPLVVRAIPGTAWRDAVSPYGYPGPVATTTNPRFWARALQVFVDVLRACDIVSCFVRLHPLLPAPVEALWRHGCVARHGTTVSIDLAPRFTSVYAGFRENHRRQIVRAVRRGCDVSVDEWELMDDFVRIHHETMDRVRAAGTYHLPADYFTRLRRGLAGHVHLVLVHGKDAQILGGGVFLETDGLVQYHLGATTSTALAEQPAKLMMAETCRWAQSRGDSVLHLGGGVGGSDTDGLFHFKAGFSDRRHPFRTWRVVVDDAAYRSLCRGTEATDPTYFPAYRAGGLPSG